MAGSTRNRPLIGFGEPRTLKRGLNLEECRENAIFPRFFPPTAWAKMYRRELLTDEVFDFSSAIYGEDMIMNIRIMFQLQRPPHFVFKKVYNYRRNTASLSHNKLITLEHEDLFDREREKSIPLEDLPKYKKAIIRSHLSGLIGVAQSEPKVLCNKKHPYMQQLREDVKQYGYQLSLQEWLMLNIQWPLLYKALSFMVMIKNFLRYRLGISN